MSTPPRPRAYFITGTDTDAGKTTSACALLAAARNQRLSTLACKPVASGSHPTPDGLRNPDALSLAEQCSIQIPYTQLNPYALAPAIAPHLAAAEASTTLQVQTLQQQVQHILDYQADLCLIEGAGGWRVPLNEHENLSDLAIALQLPVILVVGMKLGCINHALLSAESILNDGLPLAGWIANHIDPQMARTQDTLHSLQQRMPAPLLATLPWQPSATAEYLAPYVADSIARLCYPLPATQSAPQS